MRHRETTTQLGDQNCGPRSATLSLANHPLIQASFLCSLGLIIWLALHAVTDTFGTPPRSPAPGCYTHSQLLWLLTKAWVPESLSQVLLPGNPTQDTSLVVLRESNKILYVEGLWKLKYHWVFTVVLDWAVKNPPSVASWWKAHDEGR